VAVVQDGTLPTERLVNATVETISSAVKAAALKAPAIIVIGDVASFAKQKNNFHFVDQAMDRKVG
jgi:uroporphyrin-III C-methyltransferase/precorrin-2 dehydrogenase/sirohydrochlorin ferrochelatase